ncbi:hypothetical protein [Zavarzinella formosa]|uniref:hypothetical protein n=1 Tax=Zavarzinella formosa TaxID=360055 RepID=UPI000317D1DE|nr:hypothetical protein [Zavarzinella formosa]
MATIAKRFTFREQSQTSATPTASFRLSTTWVAVEEQRPLDDLPRENVWPEPTDFIDVLFVAKNEADRWEKWLAAPDHPEAVPSITATVENQTIHWRPGRAIIVGKPNAQGDALAALLEFAFYEGRFRELEAALESRHAGAAVDVEHAYRIKNRELEQKFGESIESLYSLRLVFVKIEPHLSRTPRRLSVTSRRLMARLLRRADLEGRLEDFNTLLETCEDLYEGGSDRIADYRWYRNGHRLEVGIIVLLVMEVVLMTLELISRYREGGGE